MAVHFCYVRQIRDLTLIQEDGVYMTLETLTRYDSQWREVGAPLRSGAPPGGKDIILEDCGGECGLRQVDKRGFPRVHTVERIE